MRVRLNAPDIGYIRVGKNSCCSQRKIGIYVRCEIIYMILGIVYRAFSEVGGPVMSRQMVTLHNTGQRNSSGDAGAGVYFVLSVGGIFIVPLYAGYKVLIFMLVVEINPQHELAYCGRVCIISSERRVVH